MSEAEDTPQTSEETANVPATCMESVNRFARLPVVESTIQTAHSIYEKVKDFNSVTNWTLQTAENTAFKAVDIAKPFATPVMKNFERPIKKVDDVLCSGLDYVETRVPAVRLPPRELVMQIYNSTKDLVSPAVESAKHFVEPAVNKTRSIVDPIVEPIVENVMHRVDNYMHGSQEAPEGQENQSESEQSDQSPPCNH